MLTRQGYLLTGIPPNIVTRRGIKKVRNRAVGRKGQVTIVACGNAAGQALPPMIIFDAKNLNHAWTANEVPGTKYGLSDNGWITTELFEGWMLNIFWNMLFLNVLFSFYLMDTVLIISQKLYILPERKR